MVVVSVLLISARKDRTDYWNNKLYPYIQSLRHYDGASVPSALA